VPFGNDNMQIAQTATITMRSATQQAVLLMSPTVWCVRGLIGSSF